MRLSVADVFARLRAEGLAPAEAEAAARAALASELLHEMPSYLRAAVGLGAWLATGFLLGSVFAIADLRSDVARAVIGVLLIAGAVWLRRTSTAEFLRQAAVAASLAGQGLVIFSLAEAYDSTTVAGLAGAVLSTALIWFMPDRVHRFLSILVVITAMFAVALDQRSRVPLEVTTVAVIVLSAYVWRVGLRTRSSAVSEMLAPVGYALIVALFALLLFGTMATMQQARWWIGDSFILIPGSLTKTLLTLASVALVWKVIEEIGEPHSSRVSVAALAGIVALGASTFSSPGIIGGVAVLLLAFDRRDRELLGIAVVFLLVFGSAYYYSLHLTLLQKSGVLAGSGALLLAVRQRIASRGEEVTT